MDCGFVYLFFQVWNTSEGILKSFATRHTISIRCLLFPGPGFLLCVCVTYFSFPWNFFCIIYCAIRSCLSTILIQRRATACSDFVDCQEILTPGTECLLLDQPELLWIVLGLRILTQHYTHKYLLQMYIWVMKPKYTMCNAWVCVYMGDGGWKDISFIVSLNLTRKQKNL